ncbi:cytochrome b/b6 domain-containing protein [Sphingomonas sp. BAUL-RG-20F-R05-02]|uniref:cytochrome b/b6 domain-containing protein n=1 Tax=Sphingomonas sp. BAUL-RG-20F-R05-02 TaxID=2914830 RepID=UPI001F568373|nr:cytochrome b/b6 domain-containing protein [Sphingomonas sp. BAUL-RG-20F-R05-02]
MTPVEPPAAAATSVRVWDLPVRLFHWALVALLGFSWWSGDHHDMDRHRLSGYTILALVVFRIYWGVVGSRTARFAQFVRGPRAALDYLGRFGKRPYEAADGHNPIGGWSVVLLLATLIVMVTAGLFSVDVDGLESGPLADYVSFDVGRSAAGVHHFMFNVLLALVALHVLAILFYLVALRHDLISPMLHGRRRAGATPGAPRLRASPWKAAIGIIIAGGFAYAVSKGFRL